MLTNSMVATSLPAVNIKRAKSFYVEKLGLKVVREDQGAPSFMVEAGQGSMIFVYQRAATKADHTVAMFKVENMEAEVKELKSKGINFEEYDLPKMGIKTVNSIATMDDTKAAWFKDTEGNILGLVQM